MYCSDIQSCFDEIYAYCSGTPTGKALLVNAESYDVFQEIRAKLDTDSSKQCLYVSRSCPEAGMPDLDEIPSEITGSGCHVLIGYSQAAMLRSAEFVDQKIGALLELPVHDHAIVLLDHCEQYLKKHFGIHPDIEKRVILVGGTASPLPRLHLAKSEDECIGFKPLPTMKRLFSYLEGLNDELIRIHPEITVKTELTPRAFSKALYSVTSVDGVYDAMRKKYSDIASGTEKSYGTDGQWHFLAEKMNQYGSISAITNEIFGSTVNLESHISEVMEEESLNKIWLLWLSMKVFGTKGKPYLSMVMKNSSSVDDFEEHVYMDILKVKFDSPEFRQLYIERKRLIDEFPENLALLDQYLSKIGIYSKNSVWYLTNNTDKEELELMSCLSTYDYSEEELLQITEARFPELNRYLQNFTFNSTNTKLPASAESLWSALTAYFHRYKLQKITNRIYPEHMAQVEEYAESKPYNMLQPRTSIVSKLDKKNSQLYFFDALGVEYLAYIVSQCERYNMIPEISVAHCELPSITGRNKDFIHFFPGGARDIKDLDELKHHSQIIDYQQCKLPVHLFRELEIIDSELRKIQSALRQDQFEKAVIVSDHGASRLAVINESENQLLELEEKGEHSGRCCAAASDPHIPFASYTPDGYSVLANYDRFKGSRKANVEVHGGAALEEVLVPIIVLTKKPADIDICFVDSLIKLKGKEPAAIVVFSNIPLNKPRLSVNGRIYEGEFDGDSRHARFIMPELKRTKNWTADFYDGEKKLAASLEFRVQKGDTQEVDFFKKKKLTL